MSIFIQNVFNRLDRFMPIEDEEIFQVKCAIGDLERKQKKRSPRKAEMEIQASNLLFALRVAINDQRKAEKEHGFTNDSALVAGLEDLYKHVQAGGQITILPPTN